ncbi:MAG TPA: pitrilysin family protein, partial [Thermoanaerobaculia bacterium]
MNRHVVAGGLLLVAQIGTAQTTPPPPAPPRQLTLPKPSEKTLKNGLRVIVVPKHGTPLVSSRLMVLTGSEEDTREFAGLANLTASLVTQGTKSRTAEQIARGVEALGSTLHTSAGWHMSAVDVTVMPANLASALDYVSDVVRNPSFKQEEIERLREQSIDSLRVSLQEPLSLARYVAARVVFQETPYGQNIAGTPESLERIGREQIAGFHRRYYRPDNAVLVIAGDIKPDAAFAVAQKAFGSWKGQPLGVRGQVEKIATDPPKPRVVVVDMPDAGQAAVVVTRRGLRRVDPQYFTAIVANSVLGGGYSSRLNQEIRIKRGLSYGAGSTFELRREEGPFTAWTQTKNESADEVASLIIDEMNRLASAELTNV